jgi:hypothetical protein
MVTKRGGVSEQIGGPRNFLTSCFDGVSLQMSAVCDSGHIRRDFYMAGGTAVEVDGSCFALVRGHNPECGVIGGREGIAHVSDGGGECWTRSGTEPSMQRSRRGLTLWATLVWSCCTRFSMLHPAVEQDLQDGLLLALSGVCGYRHNPDRQEQHGPLLLRGSREQVGLRGYDCGEG